MNKNFWNKLAPNYDQHRKNSEVAYSKLKTVIKNTCDADFNVLDVGTGTGDIPIALAPHVSNITATDFSTEMIKIAQRKAQELGITNITFQVQNGENTPLQKSCFNLITVVNVLHLVDNPAAFLNGLKPVLHNNGKLIISTFLHNHNLKTRLLSQLIKLKGIPVITRFNAQTKTKLIEQCGYSIEKQQVIEGTLPMLLVVARNNKTGI